MSKFTGKQGEGYTYFSIMKSGLPAMADILRQVAEEVEAIDASIDKAAVEAGFPAIQTVTEIKVGVKDVEQYDRDYSYSNRGKYNPRWEQVVAAARKHLDEVRAEAERIHAANVPAMASNKALYDRLFALMKSVGFQESYTEYTTKRGRTHSERVSSGWYRDLNRCIVLDDRYKYGVDELNRQEGRIADYEANQRWMHQEAQEKQQAETKKRQQEREVGVLAVKYGCDLESADYRSILDAILDRNRYLKLARAFYRIRCDWSDGPHDRARRALDDFIEAASRETGGQTDLDREIYDYWLEIIERQEEAGESDGRIYRDGEWSYGRLFSLAAERDPDLFADYGKVCEMLDE